MQDSNHAYSFAEEAKQYLEDKSVTALVFPQSGLEAVPHPGLQIGNGKTTSGKKNVAFHEEKVNVNKRARDRLRRKKSRATRVQSCMHNSHSAEDRSAQKGLDLERTIRVGDPSSDRSKTNSDPSDNPSASRFLPEAVCGFQQSRVVKCFGPL